MSAEFLPALARLLVEEGGWCNDPADSGGETYRGVSRNHWPSWLGWRLVDLARNRVDFPRCLDVDAVLQGLVHEFYRAEFWHADYGSLPTQRLGDKVFSIAVNSGHVVAAKLLQRALRAAIYKLDLSDDGSWGPKTRAALLLAKPGELEAALRSEHAGFYRSLVAARPTQQKFIGGWMRRAYS